MEAANKEAKSVRSAGVLLHPTSLPGPYGIGDLGPAAFAWVEALDRARQTWWQILPLNPTGYGDSPYQSVSTFAGNPYLLSPEVLTREGLVQQGDLGGAWFPADRVDYGRVIDFKLGMLGRAWERFRSGAAPGLRQPFDQFCSQQAGWLDDFALFMALKKKHNHAHWLSWPAELVRREPGALDRARRELGDAVGFYKFGQFLFRRQWSAVKRHANDRGIRLIGDLPIFVASDSADVWANPGLFLLDEQRRPKVVAGVPPDYFSSTGQLWGNPLYNWEALRRTGYAWWVARLKATLEQVDMVRLDHFRGFEAYWEVPASHTTAAEGRWVKGPGADLFETLRRAIGGLPLIAEDLGLITPEVRALRQKAGLPGMRVLQFAFGDSYANPYLPHNYDRNTVVYTGTHDNDTTRGWYVSLGDKDKWSLHRYAPWVGQDIAWDLMRLAWGSVADYAVAPLQDVLNLGNEARMNLPGRPGGNWSWRYTPTMLNDGILGRLTDLTEVYGRHPGAARP